MEGGEGLQERSRPDCEAAGALRLAGIKTGLFQSRLGMRALELRHVTRHSKTLLITVWHSSRSQLQKN